MEPIIVKEKIRTNTIPEQVVGALQNYAQSDSGVRGVFLSHGKWEGVHVNRGTLTVSDTIFISRGGLVGSTVASVTHGLTQEATEFLIKGFDAIVSKLAIESAIAQETRETTRAIGPTVLDYVSAIGGTAKVAQRTPVACRSTAQSLLKYATGWAGDDLPALLKEARKTRSKSVF